MICSGPFCCLLWRSVAGSGEASGRSFFNQSGESRQLQLVVGVHHLWMPLDGDEATLFVCLDRFDHAIGNTAAHREGCGDVLEGLMVKRIGLKRFHAKDPGNNRSWKKLDRVDAG